MKIALLPIDNLSGVPVPLRDMQRRFADLLADRGIPLLEDKRLEGFMARHRLRYTGGLDAKTAQAIRIEESVDAVLVSSLELYQEADPPKMSIACRLVTTGEKSEITWMESTALSGDEHPGLLGVGLVHDPVLLQEQLLATVATSLADRLNGAAARDASPRRTFRPQVAFGREFAEKERTFTIAVLPFANESSRKNAGEIMLLHFVKGFYDQQLFRPVEPGIVREQMLNMRIIMIKGVTLPQVDLIANHLEVDFIATGKVYDYEDAISSQGHPQVDFSMLVIDRRTKEVVWSSQSYHRGDEGVWLYDWQRLFTANRVAAGMTAGIVADIGREFIRARPDNESPKESATGIDPMNPVYLP